jgi:uncharacterized protein YidB (DUF937 family)
MDDLSKLSAGLTSGTGSSGGDPLGGLSGAIEQSGGLDGLLGRLRQGGLGDEVDSWVSTGPNRPVDPQRLGDALGPDTVQQLSSGSGLDVAALLPMLAAFLPQIIDMLTPDGNVPAGGLGGAGGGMPDLGGLLGGLMGGAGGAGAAGAGGAAGGAGLDDLLGGLGGMLGGSKER